MFKKEDLDFYNKLGNIIKQGDYNIKGNAVHITAFLLSWYDKLGEKISWGIRETVKAEAPKIKRAAKEK